MLNLIQGELEHRSPKSRYTRTDHKHFVEQLTCIECWRAHIHRICAMNNSGRQTMVIGEATTAKLEEHHFIGKSQNFPINIRTFLWEFQDFLPRLKDHLVHGMKATLVQESTSVETQSNPSYGEESTSNGDHSDSDLVYLKSEWIFLHKICRVQYTTYDAWRGQDVINPFMPHQNIMLLATTSNNNDHPFLYACVLGIYHANAIYIGNGTHNYQARQCEFLWVQWYRYHGLSVRWNNSRLDAVSFPPVSSEGVFGFVDSCNVLHACHIIPTFSHGKKYNDEVGLSHCANNSQDWSLILHQSVGICNSPLIRHIAYFLTMQLCWPWHDDEILLGSCHWPYICA